MVSPNHQAKEVLLSSMEMLGKRTRGYNRIDREGSVNKGLTKKEKRTIHTRYIAFDFLIMYLKDRMSEQEGGKARKK